MKVLKDGLEQAEQSARRRDIDAEQETHIDLEIVNQMEEKANELGYGLYKISNKNKASFVQVLEENLDIIIRKEYMTTSELGFMMSIFPLIDYGVNAIVDKKTGQFMTVTEISKYLNKDRSGTSKMIQTLLRKGILFEFVDVDEIKEFNRNVTARSLFVNPEIFYSGNRNKIDGTLSILVSKYDKLEKNNVKLNWKVWRKPSHTFGKLYARKTYLKYKKGVEVIPHLKNIDLTTFR